MSLSGKLILGGLMGEMLAGAHSGIALTERKRRYIARGTHPTKTGPGRSEGMKPARKDAGNKIANQAFQGRLGLRGRVLSGASALAQQGKLGVTR